jgi:RimJ/RimL family protein N-acetyltransferase
LSWRLKKSAWGKGFATEAAKACLLSAFTEHRLKKVLAFATDNNRASQRVMEKIGMDYLGNFQHPNIKNDPRFSHCVAYGKPVSATGDK